MKNIEKWLLLIGVSLIWGSSFILMKKGLIAFSPQQVASLRIFMASIILIPFAIKNIYLLQKKDILFILFAGFIGTGIPPFLFTKAQTVINSSTAGILNSLTPLFALAIGFFLFKLKLNINKISGVFLGLAGAIILFIFKSGDGFSINVHGLLVVLAALCYATSSTMIKSKLQAVKSLHFTSFVFLFIGPPAGIYLLFSDVLSVINTHPYATQAFGYILILSVVGTAIANLMFNKLILVSSAIFAQSVTYLMPVIAVIWGLMDNEAIELADLGGIVLILCGIFLINRPKIVP